MPLNGRPEGNPTSKTRWNNPQRRLYVPGALLSRRQNGARPNGGAHMSWTARYNLEWLGKRLVKQKPLVVISRKLFGLQQWRNSSERTSQSELSRRQNGARPKGGAYMSWTARYNLERLRKRLLKQKPLVVVSRKLFDLQQWRNSSEGTSQYELSLHSTCPNHRNLPLLTDKLTGSSHNNSLTSVFFLPSFRLKPHIRLSNSFYFSPTLLRAPPSLVESHSYKPTSFGI